MAETIVAAFDSASAAEAAVQDLQRAKIPSASIRSYTKEDPDYTGYRAREPQRKGGFWAWLLGEEPSYTTEYDAYDTSLASGHTVVTVAVDEIRRYVVRKPVEEQVTLRDETVSVERRRPVATTEAGVPSGAFEERTVEVHQTAEEPVVNKTAHIAEEIVVHKETTERTETVRDDVRREEVEVQEPNRSRP
jgi:stress response protein YsnF